MAVEKAFENLNASRLSLLRQKELIDFFVVVMMRGFVYLHEVFFELFILESDMSHHQKNVIGACEEGQVEFNKEEKVHIPLHCFVD